MDMRRGISFERLQSLGYDQAMEQGNLESNCTENLVLKDLVIDDVVVD